MEMIGLFIYERNSCVLSALTFYTFDTLAIPLSITEISGSLNPQNPLKINASGNCFIARYLSDT